MLGHCDTIILLPIVNLQGDDNFWVIFDLTLVTITLCLFFVVVFVIIKVLHDNLIELASFLIY